MAKSAVAVSNTKMEHIGESNKASLGHVQLRDQETNEIILIPTPSNDPNDPLNW